MKLYEVPILAILAGFELEFSKSGCQDKANVARQDSLHKSVCDLLHAALREHADRYLFFTELYQQKLTACFTNSKNAFKELEEDVRAWREALKSEHVF